MFIYLITSREQEEDRLFDSMIEAKGTVCLRCGL